jgi:hypothetical protein
MRGERLGSHDGDGKVKPEKSRLLANEMSDVWVTPHFSFEDIARLLRLPLPSSHRS